MMNWKHNCRLFLQVYQLSGLVRVVVIEIMGTPSVACSVVSSIEFDRDGDVFAVAGTTKMM